MPTSGKPSVVFFGSGPVAAECLSLLAKWCDIEAVITKPRPAHHRGDVPVITLTETLRLTILTASNKSELDQLITDHSFTSSVAILIDFGIIVSRHVIDIFPLGIINSHFSLLPHLRGADPITFAILNGDPTTGVSLMLIDEGMDTGELLTYRTLHLSMAETTPSLTERLILLSDQLLQEKLPLYLADTLTPKAQPHPERATYSRKLTKADGLLDWAKPAVVLEREIRAFLGWPGSRTQLGSLNVTITSAHVIEATGTPGTHTIDGKQLLIYTSDQALVVDSLKPAGKKEMPIQAFLAGYRSQLS